MKYSNLGLRIRTKLNEVEIHSNLQRQYDTSL